MLYTIIPRRDTTARTGPPRAYTPAHLAARILPGQQGLVGERKLVTVLAVSVEGLRALRQTHDLDEVDEVLNRGFAQLVAEVHRVEGFVAQVAGRHVTALFGAPGACEDQVLRALHAALGIQRVFASFAAELCQTHGVELGLRLGVHTGPVVVRGISPDLQLAYTASGATMEVASELQQWSQEGAIVVSEAVQQQAAGFFRCTALGVHTLPEVPEPMQVYTCEGVGSVTSRLERARGRGRTAFYGRIQELALLEACWRRVDRGMGQVVCLVRKAGIGKSRLAYECQQTLGAARWLTIQAFSYGQAMPYQAVIPLLRTVFGVVETALTRPTNARRSRRGWQP